MKVHENARLNRITGDDRTALREWAYAQAPSQDNRLSLHIESLIG